MLKYLAELAAYVRDVKPESDVHSNLPNHRSPLEKQWFQCCRLPVYIFVLFKFRGTPPTTWPLGAPPTSWPMYYLLHPIPFLHILHVS